jgi:2-haloacid dehalogenase
MGAEKWVTFDCYGTLLDWQSGFRRILAGVAGARADELVHAYHDAEAATEGEAPGRSYKEVLTLTLKRAAAAIGLPLGEADAGALVREWGSLPIFPDTAPALRELRADGWRLGVLTNCDDDLFARTRAVFPVPLDKVVTAQQVGSYKPALAHFERFEAESGVARERWVHAAVSWWHDIEPARKLGIRRVWVDRERSGHDPAAATVRIESLAALPAALRGFAIP